MADAVAACYNANDPQCEWTYGDAWVLRWARGTCSSLQHQLASLSSDRSIHVRMIENDSEVYRFANAAAACDWLGQLQRLPEGIPTPTAPDLVAVEKDASSSSGIEVRTERKFTATDPEPEPEPDAEDTEPQPRPDLSSDMEREYMAVPGYMGLPGGEIVRVYSRGRTTSVKKSAPPELPPRQESEPKPEPEPGLDGAQLNDQPLPPIPPREV